MRVLAVLLLLLPRNEPSFQRQDEYAGELILISGISEKAFVERGGQKEEITLRCRASACLGIYATDFRDPAKLNVLTGDAKVSIEQRPRPLRTREVVVKRAAPRRAEQPNVQVQKAAIQAALSKHLDVPHWMGGYTRPVNRVASAFGNATHFKSLDGEFTTWHRGADLSAPRGTPIHAALDGIVALVARNYFFEGNMVILNHGDGLFTSYMHLQRISVRSGQKVKNGARIGTVGSTGRSSGPHLHWSALYKGRAINPESLAVLAKAVSPATAPGRERRPSVN